MLIITGILLIAIVGCLWTVVLSLISKPMVATTMVAPRLKSGTERGCTHLNGRREVRIFYTVFTPRLVE